MGKFLKIGCFGLIVIVAVLVALVMFAPKPPPPQQTVDGQAVTLAQVGQTVSLGGWDVTLLDFGPYDRFDQRKPSTNAQGTRVVADMRIKNTQARTSNFTQTDFELKSSDGRSFKPDSVTASIARGFVVSQQVQPGLTTENRVVFDIDPAAQGLTFTALKMVFSVPSP